MKTKLGRGRRTLDFLVRFAFWLFFTFGNFGCSLGYLVRTARDLDPIAGVKAVFHLSVALWLLLRCKPNAMDQGRLPRKGVINER